MKGETANPKSSEPTRLATGLPTCSTAKSNALCFKYSEPVCLADSLIDSQRLLSFYLSSFILAPYIF